MEAEPAFVGPDGAVHLDAEPAVYLDLALIVDPGDPENYHPFRLGHALEDLGLPVLPSRVDDRCQAGVHLAHGLQELGLTRVLFLHCGYY